MKPIAALAAVAGLVVLCSAIVSGGAKLEQPGFEVSDEDAATLDAMGPDASSEDALNEDGQSAPDNYQDQQILAEPEQDGQTPGEPAERAQPTNDAGDQALPRQENSAQGLAPSEPGAAPPPAAPNEIDPRTGMVRIAPRPPLSELATPPAPQPPAPVPPDRWKPQRLFNPTASAAGIIEAKGYRVALSGIEPLSVDQSCDWQGTGWACGAQARTAFRAWLRGRAILCKLPPEAERQITVAECRVGNEDPAKWLVDSGWAKASSGSEYADAGKKAEEANKGQFGAPPPRILLQIPAPQVTLPSSDLAPSGSILESPPPEPAPTDPNIAPPDIQPAPGFPPAPAPPGQ